MNYLLSPARDAETAKQAILAGADAVYIGADSFGAREDAANSLADITQLCRFAHLYGAQVSIALNTILKDSELSRAEHLAWKLYEAGADSLIIQDLGLLNKKLPPMELHASTQCHIDTVDKAKFLEACGFDTLVLARELSLMQIEEIAKAVDCKIECFIHGALCVCYSGQCYLSHAIGGRSANRGACAQPCRMGYSLKDSGGVRLAQDSYFLNMRDMNRSEYIGKLLDAGVSIFKIEGRLKDASYVKNITAHYRKILDSELAKRNLERGSFGRSILNFEPDPSKTFNRGFTAYHMEGEAAGAADFNSPKSKGEFLGEVTRFFPDGFFYPKTSLLNVGDGVILEYKSPEGYPEVTGADVSRIIGDKVLLGWGDVFEYDPKFAKLYRNKNLAFEKLLKAPIDRKVLVNAYLNSDETFYEFKFSLADSRNISVSKKIKIADFEAAQNQDAAKSLLEKNFLKLGDSIFELAGLKNTIKSFPHMKASDINALRRTLIDDLNSAILRAYGRQKIQAQKGVKKVDENVIQKIPSDRYANCYNAAAGEFYSKMGIDIKESAPESGLDMRGHNVMRTKHCVLRELGMCKKLGKFPKNLTEPLYLGSDEVRLKIEFDCANCRMNLEYIPIR